MPSSPRAGIQDHGLQSAYTCVFHQYRDRGHFFLFLTLYSYSLEGHILFYELKMKISILMLIQTWAIRLLHFSKAQWLVQRGPIRILPWLWLGLHYLVSMRKTPILKLFFSAKQYRLESARWQLTNNWREPIWSTKTYVRVKHKVRER